MELETYSYLNDDGEEVNEYYFVPESLVSFHLSPIPESSKIIIDEANEAIMITSLWFKNEKSSEGNLGGSSEAKQLNSPTFTVQIPALSEDFVEGQKNTKVCKTILLRAEIRTNQGNYTSHYWYMLDDNGKLKQNPA